MGDDNDEGVIEDVSDNDNDNDGGGGGDRDNAMGSGAIRRDNNARALEIQRQIIEEDRQIRERREAREELIAFGIGDEGEDEDDDDDDNNEEEEDEEEWGERNGNNNSTESQNNERDTNLRTRDGREEGEGDAEEEEDEVDDLMRGIDEIQIDQAEDIEYVGEDLGTQSQRAPNLMKIMRNHLDRSNYTRKRRVKGMAEDLVFANATINNYSVDNYFGMGQKNNQGKNALDNRITGGASKKDEDEDSDISISDDEDDATYGEDGTQHHLLGNILHVERIKERLGFTEDILESSKLTSKLYRRIVCREVNENTRRTLEWGVEEYEFLSNKYLNWDRFFTENFCGGANMVSIDVTRNESDAMHFYVELSKVQAILFEMDATLCIHQDTNTEDTNDTNNNENRGVNESNVQLRGERTTGESMTDDQEGEEGDGETHDRDIIHHDDNDEGTDMEITNDDTNEGDIDSDMDSQEEGERSQEPSSLSNYVPYWCHFAMASIDRCDYEDSNYETMKTQVVEHAKSLMRKYGESGVICPSHFSVINQKHFFHPKFTKVAASRNQKKRQGAWADNYDLLSMNMSEVVETIVYMMQNLCHLCMNAEETHRYIVFITEITYLYEVIKFKMSILTNGSGSGRVYNYEKYRDFDCVKLINIPSSDESGEMTQRPMNHYCVNNYWLHFCSVSSFMINTSRDLRPYIFTNFSSGYNITTTNSSHDKSNNDFTSYMIKDMEKSLAVNDQLMEAFGGEVVMRVNQMAVVPGMRSWQKFEQVFNMNEYWADKMNFAKAETKILKHYMQDAQRMLEKYMVGYMNCAQNNKTTQIMNIFIRRFMGHNQLDDSQFSSTHLDRKRGSIFNSKEIADIENAHSRGGYVYVASLIHIALHIHSFNRLIEYFCGIPVRKKFKLGSSPIDQYIAYYPYVITMDYDVVNDLEMSSVSEPQIVQTAPLRFDVVYAGKIYDCGYGNIRRALVMWMKLLYRERRGIIEHDSKHYNISKLIEDILPDVGDDEENDDDGGSSDEETNSESSRNNASHNSGIANRGSKGRHKSGDKDEDDMDQLTEDPDDARITELNFDFSGINSRSKAKGDRDGGGDDDDDDNDNYEGDEMKKSGGGSRYDSEGEDEYSNAKIDAVQLMESGRYRGSMAERVSQLLGMDNPHIDYSGDFENKSEAKIEAEGKEKEKWQMKMGLGKKQKWNVPLGVKVNAVDMGKYGSAVAYRKTRKVRRTRDELAAGIEDDDDDEDGDNNDNNNNNNNNNNHHNNYGGSESENEEIEEPREDRLNFNRSRIPKNNRLSEKQLNVFTRVVESRREQKSEGRGAIKRSTLQELITSARSEREREETGRRRARREITGGGDDNEEDNVLEWERSVRPRNNNNNNNRSSGSNNNNNNNNNGSDRGSSSRNTNVSNNRHRLNSGRQNRNAPMEELGDGYSDDEL